MVGTRVLAVATLLAALATGCSGSSDEPAESVEVGGSASSIGATVKTSTTRPTTTLPSTTKPSTKATSSGAASSSSVTGATTAVTTTAAGAETGSTSATTAPSTTTAPVTTTTVPVAPPPTAVPADPAGVLVAVAELPFGFAATGSGAPQTALCPTLDLLAAGTPAASAAAGFSGPSITGPFVDHAVLSYADPATAQAVLDLAASAQTCGTFSATARGTPITGASFGPPELPALGEAAVRMTLTGKALVFDLRVDVVAVRSGRHVSLLGWTSVGEPVNEAALQKAAAATTQRLDALPR